MGEFADELQRRNATAVNDAALALKRGYEAQARGVTGDGRLSGTSRTSAGRRVGARYNVNTDPENPMAIVYATGPAHLIEYPTRQHLIIASGLGTRTTARRVASELGARAAFGGSGRGMFRGSQRQFIGSRRAIAEGRARNAKQALTIGGNLRAYAFHPGTRGQHVWRSSVSRWESTAAQELRQSAGKALSAVYGGGGGGVRAA